MTVVKVSGSNSGLLTPSSRACAPGQNQDEHRQVKGKVKNIELQRRCQEKNNTTNGCTSDGE